MTMYVNISPGTAPSVAAIRNQRKVAIIGRSTAYSGIIDDIRDADALLGSEFGLVVTDPAYIATKAFLSDVGGGSVSSAILYCIPATTSEQTEEEFDGSKNGTNRVFTCQYSPLTGATDDRMFYLMQPATGHTSLVCFPTGIWYSITSGWDDNVVNGVYNGAMTITGWNGLTISGVSLGAATGIYVLSEYDRLRASVLPLPIGLAYKELLNPLYNFQFMIFAYDPALETGPTPQNLTTYKYFSGNTYGGKSWLHDLFLGRSMVDQFVAAQKPCMFAFSLPERVKPGDKITGLYASGTAYNTDTYKFEDLKTMVSDQYVFLGSTKQLADASAIDPAVDLISIRMQNYRPTTTFGKSLLTQSDFPDGMESRRAMNALINPYVYIPVSFGFTEGIRWGSNLTLGTGKEGKINYVQVRNYVYKMVQDRIYSYLFGRPAYSYRGIQGLRSAIESVGYQAFSINKIIDSVFTVVIPIEPYLLNEAKLSAQDMVILASARTSTLVDGISISYLFAGDIEYINVTALFGTG
jgi:hypothetical protein